MQLDSEFRRFQSIRHYEFDYAKTLAIFFMVIIRVIEKISIVEMAAMPTGFWENFIQFETGPLVAPAFIFAMGVGLILSHNQGPMQIFKRGLKLLIVALLLNLARDVLPSIKW